MTDDRSPARALTPPSEVVNEGAFSETLQQGAPGLGEMLDRIRAALADRYEVEREIGRGGMAVVYLARDLQLGRQVAIKVIRPELAQALGIERFLREVRIAAALDHPNVVALFDSGEADGLPYYVMPYVKGESLRTRLERETRLSLDEVIGIARGLAEGLSYAHERGVIHKDIKPENILLSVDRVLIADFGIAKATADAGGETLTTYGIVLGTPEYMSPEQAMGEKVDSRSDIYALGCVVFEMLGGDPPFTGRTRSAIIAKHIQERVPSLEIVRKDAPVEVVAAVEKALAKVPGDRFATATELADALESERLTGAKRRQREKRRTRRSVGATVTAAALAVAAYLIFGPKTVDLDPNNVVVFPLVATDEATNEAGLGWEVALAVNQVFEHNHPLKAIDGRARLPEEMRASPDLMTPTVNLDVSRDRGAAYYITGAIRQNEDSLSVVLQLHDVDGDVEVTRETASGPRVSATLQSLGQAAAVRLLPELLDTPADLTPLTDRRPSAITLSVQGDREYRNSRFGSALEFYHRAVAEDSMLAFAAVKGAQAASWHRIGLDEAEQLIGVALENDSLLPPKYRHFAHGLDAYLKGWPDSALTQLQAALEIDGAWSEAWMALGEVYYHFIPALSGSQTHKDLAEAAFDSAWANDETFTPPLFHLAEIAIRSAELEQAAAYANRFIETRSDTTLARKLSFMLQCVRDGPDRMDWARATRENPTAVGMAAKSLSVGAIHPECATPAFRSVLEADSLPATERWGAVLGLQGLLLADGKYEEALGVLATGLAQGLRATYSLYMFDAIAGAPFDSLAGVADALVRSARGEYYERAPSYLRWLLGVWLSQTGETERLEGVVSQFVEFARVSDEPYDRVRADALMVHLDLAEGRRDKATERLRHLVSAGPQISLSWDLDTPLPFERLLLAELLLSNGQAQEAHDAAAVFDHPGPIMYLPMLPASLAVRFRAAVAMGRPDLAEGHRGRLEKLGWSEIEVPSLSLESSANSPDF